MHNWHGFHAPAELQAGAAEKGVPLYRHIADLAGNKKLILPVPSLNIINGGFHCSLTVLLYETAYSSLPAYHTLAMLP